MMPRCALMIYARWAYEGVPAGRFKFWFRQVRGKRELVCCLMGVRIEFLNQRPLAAYLHPPQADIMPEGYIMPRKRYIIRRAAVYHPPKGVL